MDQEEARPYGISDGCSGLVQRNHHWPITWLVALLMRYFLFALLPLLVAPSSFISSEGDTQGRGSRSMPIGLREHAWNNMRITHLLRGRSDQWRSLQRGVDEYWCWLLQKEERGSRHLLNKAKWKIAAPKKKGA